MPAYTIRMGIPEMEAFWEDLLNLLFHHKQTAKRGAILYPRYPPDRMQKEKPLGGGVGSGFVLVGSAGCFKSLFR